MLIEGKPCFRTQNALSKFHGRAAFQNTSEYLDYTLFLLKNIQLSPWTEKQKDFE